MMNVNNVEILDQYNIKCLFHMTHIDNVANILGHGLLAHGNPYQREDISDCDVNSRRSRSEPIYHKPIHSYVPFYFNPKNNMLSKRRSIQKNIVILVLKRELILSNGALFTNGNASVDRTQFSNNLDNLSELNWECINTNGYYSGYDDGANKRMAEVLVPDFVDTKNILGIICNNSLTKAKLDALTHNKIESSVSTGFYF